MEIILYTLSEFVFVTLVISAFFTSMLTASLGAGGGILMLGIIAQIMPPQLIIPIHGIIQFGSNAGRAGMSWHNIDWKVIIAFLPGAIIGSLIGLLVLVTLPPAIMYLSIAGFILFLCWGPKLPKIALGTIGIATASLITTFLTLFVGATGPLVGAFVKQIHTDKLKTIATFAAVMTLQHTCKIAIFGYTGFNLTPWIPLLIFMIISGALGTWVGLHLSKKLPDKYFHLIFNILLSALAFRLIWQAIDMLN
ncbi:MAG: sulfite exporter TauE/SafE family protein [Gammaproteobacteria bacterium]|nr:sulfite exporter TauE/SafE family protein [Gammaproteobacteria bacterium]MBU1466987.1 sulfite exporter TauE/SafE family protein [Gammaproteobacteria bacterium]MBU2023560.1 sulfite exporter TauE/SafE family protein [Gammaproteobacteria bacterium]MBU2237200.1 sulfite exporter TauE/SafE family protein [Gammaproteobacteria bacterium]MBU2317178.1 sulfite exporter TauE/SafE family protein [Gammaproteobacteria bacterium]